MALDYYQSGATGQIYPMQAQQPFGGQTPPLTFNQPLVGNLLGAYGRQRGEDLATRQKGYSSLLGDISTLTQQLLGDVGQAGVSRRGEINEQFGQTLNTALGRLQDRGIGGSTYATNAALGAERQRQFSLNQLAEQLLGQQVGIKSQLGQVGFDVKERALQPTTDPNFLLSLIGSVGRGGEGLNATLEQVLGGRGGQGFASLF